jgi:cell division protein FtsB
MALLRPRVVAGVTAIVALVAAISLIQEMSRRLQIQREVRQLEAQAEEMQRTIANLENLNQYFRTDDYQERLAREKLSYQAPGEKVVLVPDEAQAHTNPSSEQAERVVPIIEKWWRIFFVPEG